MDQAVYREAEVVGQLGTLNGATNLNVFICIGCVGAVDRANFVMEAATVHPGQVCPQCHHPLVVKFGTSRER